MSPLFTAPETSTAPESLLPNPHELGPHMPSQRGSNTLDVYSMLSLHLAKTISFALTISHSNPRCSVQTDCNTSCRYRSPHHSCPRPFQNLLRIALVPTGIDISIQCLPCVLPLASNSELAAMCRAPTFLLLLLPSLVIWRPM